MKLNGRLVIKSNLQKINDKISGGSRWWREVVVEGDGGGWWWRVV